MYCQLHDDRSRLTRSVSCVLGIGDGALGITLEAVDVNSPRVDSEVGHHDIKDFPS